MKKQPTQSATSLPPSPDAERRVRMRKYFIAMGLRLVCFGVVFLVPGWWKLIPIAGAVFLPYIAVVLANAVIQTGVSPVERPGALVPASGPQPTSADG